MKTKHKSKLLMLLENYLRNSQCTQDYAIFWETIEGVETLTVLHKRFANPNTTAAIQALRFQDAYGEVSVTRAWNTYVVCPVRPDYWCWNTSEIWSTQGERNSPCTCDTLASLKDSVKRIFQKIVGCLGKGLSFVTNLLPYKSDTVPAAV